MTCCPLLRRTTDASIPSLRLRPRPARRNASDAERPLFLRSPATHASTDRDTLVVHRDDETGTSTSTHGAHLLDEKLHLDPVLDEIAARLALARLLDPDWLSQSILADPYLNQPAFLTTPPLTAPSPLVPRGKGPEKARAGKPGDVLSGVLKIPSVEKGLDRLKDQAAERASREWGSLSTGGKTLLLTHTILIGGGALTGIATDPEARGAVLGLLNGRVVPVPYTNGSLGLELNTKGDNLMFGVHLDVGQWLPKSLGFGKGSPKAIGAPTVRRSADPAFIARSPGCGCGGSCAHCAGVRVSQPGDPDEIEADRVADHVMRAPSAAAGGTVHAAEEDMHPLRRQAAEGDTADEAIGEEEEELHRSAAPTSPAAPARDVGARIRHLSSAGGTPLPPFVRSDFERRFGADFSRVRVHTGGVAGDLAKAVQARAFTVGDSIAFAPGHYAPHSSAGQRLLAHELTHVVQAGA